MKTYLSILLSIITSNVFSQKTLTSINEIKHYQYPDSVTEIILYNKNKKDTNNFSLNIIRFKNIKTIDISNYNLKDFELPGSDNLENICLNNCNLNKIPRSIFTCKNLKILDLSSNQISYIHKNISKLKKLKRLRLNKNNITELPDKLFKIKSLTDLILAKNPINKIPEKIGKLLNLEQLAISDTKISDLPSELKSCKKLKTIYIKGTPLAKNKKRTKELENILNKELLIYPIM